MPFVVGPSRNPIIAAAFAGLRKQERAEKRAASKHPPAEQDEPAPAKRRAPAKKAADKSKLAHPKEHASQHGTYMAIVRRLACRRCGAPPPSEKKGNEFCHRDEGKGAGIKTDVREGWAGCPPCHKAVGEGTMPRAEKRRLNNQYAASTRAEVEAKGLWPKSLPKWKGPKQ